MTILNYILLSLLFALTPAAVLWLCRRYPILDKIGPIMVLYGVGMIIGNLPFIPSEMATVQEMATNITIPLAIPMMLFGCRFTMGEARLQLKVAISGFLSVALAVAGGYLLFGHHIERGAEVGGIISGMYTGGTLNAAALQAIFRINGESFVLINSYDIIISFLYFVFLFTIGIRIYRRMYGEKTTPVSSPTDEATTNQKIEGTESNPYRGLWSRNGAKEIGKIAGVTLGVVAISALSTLPFPSEWFMVIFILMLTTLSVVASLFEPIRNMGRSYDLGMYLIYIFSLAVASMADFSRLDIQGGLYQMGYMFFAVFVSLTLHAIFCRIAKVGADSMIISSVAFINSPPFVPMAAAAMKNRSVLMTGLGAGVIGYAVGNHFGVLMANILSML